MLLRSQRASFGGGTGPFLLTAFFALACGNRTVLRASDEEAEVPEPACTLEADCEDGNACTAHACVEGACQLVYEVTCGEAAACESVACNPGTGQCETTPLVVDLDQDGVFGPLPGTRPGGPGSCGRDCDDTNPLAYPGGDEVCDGADNDCDGIIDNGSEYTTATMGEVPEIVSVASPKWTSSGKRGLAYGDGVFMAAYWASVGVNLPFIRGFDADGNEAFSETQLAQINGPSFGASVAWSGATFGAAWSDPRANDSYEIYFNRFDSQGQKLDPDLRITTTDDFSIHPRVIFDQGRYVIVWDDRRDEDTLGITRVMAQLIDPGGKVIGNNVPLSGDFESGEYPEIAATTSAFGVVYSTLSMNSVGLTFRAFDKQFSELAPPTLVVSDDVFRSKITAVGDLFVVTWDEYASGPGSSIMGAVLSQEGQILIEPAPITSGATFARSHSVLSLGDRFLLAWTDDFDGNYELYAAVLDLGFNVIEPRRRLTFDEADTIGAELALGDLGRVGVLFDDWRSGSHQAYFLSLGCAPHPTIVK